jgi:succinate-acetate transporter protein
MSTETTAGGRPIAERPVLPDITVADPAPLGLAAFALTTFVLSLANADIWKGEPTALALAAAYGGTVQLLAGMWEFKRNNTFGATAFSSYGGFWLSFFAYVIFFAKDGTPEAVGVFLCGWTIFTAYMTVASLRVSAAVALVFVLLTITFAFLTVGAFNPADTGISGWTKAGGWVGVATAAAAWYASFAGVVNSTFRRVVLPVYPLNV